MKKIVLALLFLAVFFQPKKVNAQTTLAAGDMAFIGWNTTGKPDAFSFVTFVNLSIGTTFFFSDNPYHNGSFCSAPSTNISNLEHCLLFTATQYIVAGTLITYDDSQSYPTVGGIILTSTVAACGGITVAFSSTATAGNNAGLHGNGDNGFIFQGSYAAPTFICGIKDGSNWNSSGNASCTQADDAELPAGLTDGTNCLHTSSCSSKDAAYFSCASTASAANVFNSANWSCGNNITLPTSLGAGCNFSNTVNPCILPIELASFTAAPKTQSVELNWATLSEIDNDFFTIEQSTDGNLFKEVAQVKGAGNSQVKRYYTISDKNPTTGVSYYRLKQTDFNGNYKYYTMLKVNYDAEVLGNITVHPNPATELASVNFYAENNSAANIALTNYLGAVVYTQTVETQKGLNSVEVSLKEIPAGIYFLKVTGAGITDSKSFKLIKQ